MITMSPIATHAIRDRALGPDGVLLWIFVAWPSYTVSLILFYFLLEGLETSDLVHRYVHGLVFIFHSAFVTIFGVSSTISDLILGSHNLYFMIGFGGLYIFVCIILRFVPLKP